MWDLSPQYPKENMDAETFESLRAECERLKHKLAYHESDIARVESLKERVSALAWENDSLRDKAQALRANVAQYQGIAMAMQRGLLTWAKTPEAATFRANEAEKLRLLVDRAEFEEPGAGQASYGPPVLVK